MRNIYWYDEQNGNGFELSSQKIQINKYYLFLHFVDGELRKKGVLINFMFLFVFVIQMTGEFSFALHFACVFLNRFVVFCKWAGYAGNDRLYYD